MKQYVCLVLFLVSGLAFPLDPSVCFSQSDHGDTTSGQRDLLVMMPAGPIHLRLTVTDGTKSMEELRSSYVDLLIAKLDTNKDGQLSSDETKNSALFMTGRRFGDTALAQSLAPVRGLSRSAVNLSIERAIGQSMVFRQLATVADQDLQVFKVLDEDGSGLIDRIEMRTAAARLAARDMDHDHCITFDEFISNNLEGMMNDQVANMMNSDGPPPPVHSELLRDAREPVMASRLVRRYDADRDGKLAGSELGWDEKRVAELDANHDGLLVLSELSKLPDATPDMAIKIRMEKGLVAVPSFQLISTRLEDRTRNTNSGAIEVKLDRATLGISYRQNDPVGEAIKNARDTFNSIDLDGNGYMDREEITTHPRFQRYLFDAMDADHDDRVFSNEMDEYVLGFAEPSATTCQVTLFDSGNGHFQRLDLNADGRISIRELRNSEKELQGMAGPNSDKINPSQLPRFFRIEIQRGGPMLFGAVNRPRTDLPQTLQRSDTGPIWFQRMDRNGDGDLVWDEFLGPREIFDRLDQDHDNLIDATEAMRSE